MGNDLLLTNLRPLGGAPTSMLLRDGRIAVVGAAIADAGVETIDCAGALALPGLVEAHTHLDKTLLGMDWYRNDVGPSLTERIVNERNLKKTLGIDAARQSARQVVQSIARGTTHIRTHVDVDTEVGLGSIEGVLATRERYRDVIDIEIVAFPQSGMLIRPGTAELMEEALRLGADVVGGLDPCGMDRDPRGHLDTVFGLAERHGRPVDIHLHEFADLGAFTTELIIERTRALGMGGRVTISHGYCLGMPDPFAVGRLIEGLAAAEIAVMTVGPGARPAPPVKRLVEGGVTVCTGNDGIRDAWGPYGNCDMLERAMLLGLRNGFRRDDELELALDLCTRGGASMMGVRDYGLEAGCQADLVVVEAETVAHAIVERPADRLVIKRGRIVARDGKAVVDAP